MNRTIRPADAIARGTRATIASLPKRPRFDPPTSAPWGLTHRDFIGCPADWWPRLDWSLAHVDMGPSPAGNLGPYWHVPLRENDPDDETVQRLYPRILTSKWLPLIRAAVAEVSSSHGAACPYCGSKISRIELWLEWLNMLGWSHG
jgi:hypothetical protein